MSSDPYLVQNSRLSGPILLQPTQRGNHFPSNSANPPLISNARTSVFSKTSPHPKWHLNPMTNITNQAKTCRATIIPSLRYRNALAAIDWLIAAFGFEKQAVYLAPDNTTVMHAQLTFGNGMVMLGSVDNGGETASFMVQPDEIGMRETKGAYLVVSDCDAIYAT